MTRSVYGTPAWKAVRKMVLARDGYVCQHRFPKCSTVATAVDHVIELADGGAPYDPSNLVASCRGCNISKRNRALAARARLAEHSSNVRRF